MQGRGSSWGGEGRHCHSVIGFVEAVAAEGKQCPVAAPALGGGDPELVEPCSVWRLRCVRVCMCVWRGDVCRLLSGCHQVRSRPIFFRVAVSWRMFFVVLPARLRDCRLRREMPAVYALFAELGAGGNVA